MRGGTSVSLKFTDFSLDLFGTYETFNSASFAYSLFGAYVEVVIDENIS